MPLNASSVGCCGREPAKRICNRANPLCVRESEQANRIIYPLPDLARWSKLWSSGHTDVVDKWNCDGSHGTISTDLGAEGRSNVAHQYMLVAISRSLSRMVSQGLWVAMGDNNQIMSQL
jgi:hypothetical protein